MSTHIRKETQSTNAEGVVEKIVETVDYRSSPGQCQEMRRVEVTHQMPPSCDNSNTTSGGGGLLSSAADSAASTLQSAKDAISGSK